MPKGNSKQGAAVPTLAPPEETASTGGSVGATIPDEAVLVEDLLAQAGGATATGAPTETPPEEVTVTTEVTAWQSDKRINALWSIDEPRNSWVGVAGLGWRKLKNTSDSAITAMTVLAAHGKQLNCRVDLREEADGMIHEMYVW